MPLLLAGLAFGKGYLIGNIADRKARSYGGQHKGYGNYHTRSGYNYQPYYQDAYQPYQRYNQRRADAGSEASSSPYQEDASTRQYQQDAPYEEETVHTLQQQYQISDQYQLADQYQTQSAEDQYPAPSTSTQQYQA